MRVLKFGGKSLDSKEKVQKICKNIKKIYKNDPKLIIVVSAMGDETNALLEKAQNFSMKNPSGRELSLLLSTGEIQSACLFSMMLSSMGVPSIALTASDISLHTFGGYQNATIYYLDKSKLQSILDKNQVAVVCGFQGINNLGEITTLGRGGSDTTAVAIASAFFVTAEIYSNYDGVFAGDPQALPYKKIKTIDYSSMQSMARAGAKVLDARAVEIAEDHNITILSKSSADFNGIGSTISKIADEFISVSKSENLTLFTIIFNNISLKEKLTKIVLKSLNSFKIYNLTIKETKINILVSSLNATLVESILAHNLAIIKKQD